MGKSFHRALIGLMLLSGSIVKAHALLQNEARGSLENSSLLVELGFRQNKKEREINKEAGVLS